MDFLFSTVLGLGIGMGLIVISLGIVGSLIYLGEEIDERFDLREGTGGLLVAGGLCLFASIFVGWAAFTFLWQK